jgi:AcrR family transcriptional regulator
MTDPEDRPDPPPDTYRELMEAGYGALVEHGYADLSMRNIAARTDRSHSLLQHYYGSKTGVVLAVLEYLVDGYLADVEATDAAPDRDPVERLRRDLERALTGPADEPADRFWGFQTALFELRLAAREDAAVRERFREGERRVTARFADSVRAGVEAGVFREVDPDRLALTLRDLVDAARFRRVLMDESDAPDRTLTFLEDVLLPALTVEDGPSS